MIYLLPGLGVSAMMIYGAPDYLMQHPLLVLAFAIVGLFFVLIERKMTIVSLSRLMLKEKDSSTKYTDAVNRYSKVASQIGSTN